MIYRSGANTYEVGEPSTVTSYPGMFSTAPVSTAYSSSATTPASYHIRQVDYNTTHRVPSSPSRSISANNTVSLCYTIGLLLALGPHSNNRSH